MLKSPAQVEKSKVVAITGISLFHFLMLGAAHWSNW
jgi:hypothetical protein